MLKMLLDPMGGIVLTNDGNAILREIDVAHPAAKSMIELARAQDEEVGDGTTSVIILAGEIMSAVEGFLERDIHPTVIVNAYFKALEEIVRITESFGVCTMKAFIYSNIGNHRHRKRSRPPKNRRFLHWHQILLQVGQPDRRPCSEGCEDCLPQGGRSR